MDYYNDGASQSTATDEMDHARAKEGMDDEHDPKDEGTALLSKSVTGGKDFRPGDEIVLEVVRILEDEIEVKYASEKGGKDKEEESEPSMSAASESNNSPYGDMMS